MLTQALEHDNSEKINQNKDTEEEAKKRIVNMKAALRAQKKAPTANCSSGQPCPRGHYSPKRLNSSHYPKGGGVDYFEASVIPEIGAHGL